jgi:PleD family two-component response regulator
VVTSEVDMGGAFLPLTVSLGIAEIIFDTDRSIETIISRADKALYQVKQQGRNHAAIYKAE